MHVKESEPADPELSMRRSGIITAQALSVSGLAYFESPNSKQSWETSRYLRYGPQKHGASGPVVFLNNDELCLPAKRTTSVAGTIVIVPWDCPVGLNGMFLFYPFF